MWGAVVVGEAWGAKLLRSREGTVVQAKAKELHVESESGSERLVRGDQSAKGGTNGESPLPSQRVDTSASPKNCGMHLVWTMGLAQSTDIRRTRKEYGTSLPQPFLCSPPFPAAP